MTLPSPLGVDGNGDMSCERVRGISRIRGLISSARLAGIDVIYLSICSRTGACLRSDAVSDGWMTDVMLCLMSQSEIYSPAQYHVL